MLPLGQVVAEVSGPTPPQAQALELFYPSSATDDFAIGGTGLAAAFSVDESSNTVRIGDGAGTNASLNMYASDGATGLISYNTSDQWDFSGGDADFNQGVAIGSGIGEPATDRTLAVGTNFAFDNTTYQIYSSNSITSPTLTADRSSYGMYMNLTNNKTEDTVNGWDSDSYGLYGRTTTTGTSTFRSNYGIYGQATTSSTAASDLGSLYGVYGYANFDSMSGTVPSAFGLYGIFSGDTSAGSTGVVTSAYANANVVYPYWTNVGTAYGNYNSVRTQNGYGGDITTAYGTYNEINVDSDDDGNITTGFAGRFVTSKRATANNMTNAYGLYVDANAGTTTYGAYIATDDTAATANYGLFINSLNAVANNYGIWGDNGDWILDADGNGIAGGTGAGGDLILGEGQDLKLYHDGTNSYIANSTGDLYVQSGTNDVILANSGGLVGIGSVTPGYKLDVVSGSAITARFNGRVIGGNAVNNDEFVTLGQLSGGAGQFWQRALGALAPSNVTDDVLVGSTATASAIVKLPGLINQHALFNLGTGSVGIGTTAPSRKLSIGGTSEISLTPTGSVAADSTAGLYWSSDSNYALHRTPGAWSAPDYQQLKIQFITGIVLNPGTSYGKSYVDIQGNGLRVTSGNVGIGTTNPANFKLQIAGDVGPTVNATYNLGSAALRWNNIYASGDIIATGLWDADTDTGIQVEETADEDKIRFDTAGSERMIIDNSGNIGIGSTSPTTLLDIRGYRPGQALVKIQDTTGTLEDYVSVASSSGAIMFRMAHNGDFFAQKFVSTSNSNYFVEPSSVGTAAVLYGNVGIGTSALPDAKLDILSTTEQLRLTHTDNTVDSRFTVDGSGNLTIDNTGTKTIVADDFQVSGNDILDSTAVTRISLGSTTTLTNSTTTLSGTSTLTASQLGTITTAASVNWGGATSLTFTADNATINGSDVADGDLTLQGTSNATRTNSFILLQPSGGNVGIGTTNPRALLELTNSTGPQLQLRNTTAPIVGTVLGEINGTGQLYPDGAKIRFVSDIIQSGGNYDTNIEFQTWSSASLSTKMIIKPNGNVGIGTTAPTNFKLQVSGNIGAQADNTSDVGSSSVTWRTGYFGTSVRAPLFFSPGTILALRPGTDVPGDGIQFQNAAGSTAVMTVDTSNERVGIGTTTPDSKLSINGTSLLNFVQLNVSSNDSQALGRGGKIALSGLINGSGTQAYFATIHGFKANSTADNQEGYFTISTNAGAGPAERLRITSNGNVGIGTTTVPSQLYIRSAVETRGMAFTSSTTHYSEFAAQNSASNGIMMRMYGTAASGTWAGVNVAGASALFSQANGLFIGHPSTTNIPIIFGKSDAEYMRITNGNVGIGIQAPSAKLEIYDTPSQGDTNAGGGNLVISTQANRAAGVGGTITFKNSSSTTSTTPNWTMAKIMGLADNSDTGSAAGRLQLSTRYWTGSAWDWRTGMVLNSSGNVGINTTSASQKLDISGGSVVIDNNTGSNANAYEIQRGGTDYPVVWMDTDAIYLNNPFNNSLNLRTNNTARLSITGAGAIYAPAVYSTTTSARNVYVNADGLLGYLSSSIVNKTNVETIQTDTSIKLYDLRPVKFEYKDSLGTIQYGLIAEEVAQTIPEMAFYDENGNPAGVSYQYLAPLLLAEVQKHESKLNNYGSKFYNIRFYRQHCAIRVANWILPQLKHKIIILSTIIGAHSAVIGYVRAGLINTQELVVEQTASIKPQRQLFTIQGMSLADYIASVIGGQVTSTGTALISPVGNDTVITTATVSGEIAFTNTDGETVAAITEDGDFSATGTSSLSEHCWSKRCHCLWNTRSKRSYCHTSKLGTILADGPATFSATVSANSLIANEIRLPQADSSNSNPRLQKSSDSKL
jgi:hypothetical protein